jgi:hypothetical protein
VLSCSNNKSIQQYPITMSFFGGGQQQPQGPDPVFAAKTELEMYTGEWVNSTKIRFGGASVISREGEIFRAFPIQ